MKPNDEFIPWSTANDGIKYGREELVNTGEMVHIGSMPYVDDGNLMSCDPDANKMEAKGIVKMKKWRRTMKVRSFKTNWTKSMGLTSLQDQGSRQTRKNLKTKGNEWIISANETKNMGVVQKIESLGLISVDTGLVMEEVKYRISTANESMWRFDVGEGLFP